MFYMNYDFCMGDTVMKMFILLKLIRRVLLFYQFWHGSQKYSTIRGKSSIKKIMKPKHFEYIIPPTTVSIRHRYDWIQFWQACSPRASMTPIHAGLMIISVAK